MPRHYFIHTKSLSSSVCRRTSNDSYVKVKAMRSAVIVLVLVVVSMVVAANIKSYQEHHRRLNKYPCKRPQPRVIELEDLEDNQELMEMVGRVTKERVKPAVTVLHRCQSSGCCKSSQERCMPIATKDVLLTFAVTDRMVKYVQVKEKEHTHCGCVPIE